MTPQVLNGVAKVNIVLPGLKPSILRCVTALILSFTTNKAVQKLAQLFPHLPRALKKHLAVPSPLKVVGISGCVCEVVSSYI